MLGVPKDADVPAIKRAYRKKAKASHPDKNGGDGGKMAEVNRCYALLVNPESRKRYDETGKEQPPKGPTPEQELDELFIDIVSSFDCKFTDLVKEAKRYLAASQAQHSQEMDKSKRVAERFRDAAKRLTRKSDKPNSIAAALVAKAEACDFAFGASEHRLANCKTLAAVLEEYEYRVDERQADKALQDYLTKTTGSSWKTF